MTSFLTFHCNGDCAAAESEDNLTSNEVTAISISGRGLAKTVHLCNAECIDRFMNGTLSGSDIFLADDDDEETEPVTVGSGV